ncbi:CGNR zinc finger domain-containing protein [Streptomyces cocklensis]|uniref:Stress-induced transcription regulator n=1 Tax=Actinacidiphila cocklensis TaxID=887465 RepID=A0A9W4DN11_9ACTN|nr:CGNR zinc finger domain-containing protein [Actinacidiphila cocklensis]MDD1058932.1 CGNR zinc finger domain-containing protein [Actinacidiphila cocklensis]WSX73543.1 CGNR zinc finger domain-containing protein [Streptomyces sp. NBC_00899]WSX80393.1 CGNR zinc finger domain-containing protein [Streptomyces sp. NBC_00899]CAG6394430.1 Putative stress-induced transcription regulator [Actinacidiphila cocklensis]
MLINHDTRCALDSVVDLINTAPAIAGRESLAEVADLRAFVERNKVSEIGRLDRLDISAVHAVRTRFTEVFATTDDATASTMLNAMIAEAGTTPRLTDHDGYDWHVHYFAPGASLSDHLAADCGMALAFLIVAGERERLRRCDAPDCRHAFVDLSRNRSRRYCDSRTCGNRLHVAAYRARRREAGEAGTDEAAAAS